jgi:hypothetical protein
MILVLIRYLDLIDTSDILMFVVPAVAIILVGRFLGVWPFSG